MALSNYTELQTAIANWLNRSDLTAQIPDFINLAESYMNDELRLRSMITEGDITPSQTVKYVALPTGFLEPISFVDDQGNALIQVHHEDLSEMQYESSAWRPQYYSITNQINFERTAGGTHTYKLTYYKGLDIATDTTNDVLTNYPNIYLYGSLLQAEPYVKNDPRMGTWSQLYDVAIKKANNRNQESLKKLRTDHPSLRSHFDINRGF